MNPSKEAKPFGGGAVYALPFLAWVAVLVHAWFYYIEYPLCHVGDVYGYYCQISSGDITNWWSALYMFECRWVMKAISLLSGHPENACWGMFVMKAVTISTLFCSVELFLFILSKVKSALVWPAAVLLCAAGLGISITSVRVIESMIGRLDICGTSLLCFAVVGSISLNFCKGRLLRGGLLVVIAISMLHACLFRSPFMALVPLLSLYITATLSGRKLFSRMNLLRGGVVCCCSFICLFAVGEILPSHKHTYPASVMLVSELRIASVLEHDERYVPEVLAGRVNKTPSKITGLAAAIFPEIQIETKEDWHVLLEEYFDYVRKHPLAMAEARLLQCVEFCTSNDVPSIVKQIIHHFHPYVGTGSVVYGEYQWPVSNRSVSVSAMYYFAFLLWLVGGIVPCIHYWLTCRRHGGESESFMLRTELYLGLMCLASLLCYMVVVVPSPDFRYRSQTLILGVMSLSWLYAAAVKGKSFFH